MRLVLDSLIALMLVGILAAVLLHYRDAQRRLEEVRFVHRSLAELHEQATYHRALEQARLAGDGADFRPRGGDAPKTPFPSHISPNWFDEHLPLNVLVDTRQPWIDLAPKGDLSAHPPDPVVRADDQAGFWYNASRGIFRARVPSQLSEQKTLRLYNRVNGTALMTLPEDESADRAPRAHSLTPDAARRQATRDAARSDKLKQTFDAFKGAAVDLGTTASALLPANPTTTVAAAMPDIPLAAPAGDSTEPTQDRAMQEAGAPAKNADAPDARRPGKAMPGRRSLLSRDGAQASDEN